MDVQVEVNVMIVYWGIWNRDDHEELGSKGSKICGKRSENL